MRWFPSSEASMNQLSSPPMSPDLIAAYGEPRETRDADLTVLRPDTEGARQALLAAGLRAVTAFEEIAFGGLFVSRIITRPARRQGPG